MGQGVVGSNRLLAGLLAFGVWASTAAAQAIVSPTPASLAESQAAKLRRPSWAVQAIGADRLHELGLSGKGVIVAVVDSGLGGDGPALEHNLSVASVDIVPRRMAGGAGDRHAVYVAETVIGSPLGEGPAGVASGATILSVRADSDGACRKECAFNAGNLARAVDYAVASHAQIIDLSLAGDHPLGARFERALARAAEAGTAIIVAAGNEGRAQPEWPARYAADPRFAGAVVAVGATNKRGELAGFSDRAGSARASYIAAPGQKLITDCDSETCAIVSGTSFAAPQVAGALALLLEAFPDLNGRQALDLLLRTARAPNGRRGDAAYGRGRLDVYGAYELALAEQRTASGNSARR